MASLLPLTLFLSLVLTITVVSSTECNEGTIALYSLDTSNPLRCLYGLDKGGSAVFNSLILSRYSGIYGLAPNQVHLPWGTGEHCGKCFELSGPKGYVLGVVMDTTTQAYRSPVLYYADDSNYIHFDVINQAGTAATLIGANTWPVRWRRVACPWTGNVKFTFLNSGSDGKTTYFYFFDFLDALSKVEVCYSSSLSTCVTADRYGIRFGVYTPFNYNNKDYSTIWIKVTSATSQVVTGTFTTTQFASSGSVYSLSSNFQNKVVASSSPCRQSVNTKPIFSSGAFSKDFTGGSTYRWKGSTGTSIVACPGYSSVNCLSYPFTSSYQYFETDHWMTPIYGKFFTSLSVTAYASAELTVNFLLNWGDSVSVTFPAKSWVTKTITFSTSSSSSTWTVSSTTIMYQLTTQTGKNTGTLYIKEMKMVPKTLTDLDASLPNVTPWKVNGVQAGSISETSATGTTIYTGTGGSLVVGVVALLVVTLLVVLVVLIVVVVVNVHRSKPIENV